jgi:hypothetical protein
LSSSTSSSCAAAMCPLEWTGSRCGSPRTGFVHPRVVILHSNHVNRREFLRGISPDPESDQGDRSAFCGLAFGRP